ncbi:ribosomal protein S5 domain 2-type protein [Cokeromyces recurvatus]|uniref:ribosomal protein S5 domain 2-type protein n=1 Tax=Cokeromyces recurvatus TaxID=90255 RepID=UPI0022206CA0|nr:ribosomal protein S5 domain 2-type protein [Cokeromyces recurvatus]KAI7908196.1 ribosomal protein S5 domain 2-type protein [Cokeromyces recurvatus]
MTQNYTVASAPGKVLIAGGYLVLEQAFTGLVVGTTARFYTVIRPETQSKAGIITVRSPQFENAVWQYKTTIKNEHLQFESITLDSQNKFVETCLKFTLKVIFEKIGSDLLNQLLANGIEVVIVGDNDFYSQRAELEKKHLPNTAEALASLEPFCKTHATLSTVHKTGLGSSAALTTSLVAALLLYFRVVTDTLNETEKVLIHNVAQYVHCFAQGKVGSGFDVSSAVWGSHRYKRFNPAILAPIMNEQVDSKTLSQELDSNNKNWDNEVASFKLPPGFKLMLADIDAGSHTPTLVSKVLAWKKSKPEEAISLWNELGAYNAKVEQHFRKLTDLYEEDEQSYNETIKMCAQLKSKEWYTLSGSVAEEIISLVNDFNHVRSLLQTMSKLSDVPIEPEEQTRLLDASTHVPGVVMAGVPGAGGYDAIFCIVLSEQSKQNVYKVWESWKELNIGPLLSQADSHGVTSVKLDDIPGLNTVLSK